jgi:hypothetical protein
LIVDKYSKHLARSIITTIYVTATGAWIFSNKVIKVSSGSSVMLQYERHPHYPKDYPAKELSLSQSWS